jgi:hypothetical protein
MDKKIAGLLGAAAAIATVGGANATEVQGAPQNPTASYRELLNPVPNAVAALKADDARRDAELRDGTKVAQVSVTFGHHHHHHVRVYHHHHHHHHRYFRHHHHHHHHHGYYVR